MTRNRITRRQVLSAGGAVGALGLLSAKLKAAPRELTVAEALAARHSTRTFSSRSIDPTTRDAVLWAAFGINRPDSGGHTAPSWHGAADTLVYVADASGVSFYEPEANSVRSMTSEDIRDRLSPQPWVATAPMSLILVADLARLAEAGGSAPEEERRLFAHVDSAVVAQNVYLTCASLGLGTCLVGGINREAIDTALSLDRDRLVTFVQPVGWAA